MRANKFAAAMAATILWTGTVAAQNQTNAFQFIVNQAIPDANASGLALSTNLSGLPEGILDVSVTLDIAGGFNGDLYAYLVRDSGFAVLLNRVGMSSANAAGYDDAGFTSLVLSDTGSGGDIHFYGGNGGLPLSGIYQPDGRTTDPLITPAADYDAASRTAFLSSFDGLSPNGEWVLFLADLSGSGVSTLNSWGLTIVTVPEPSTWALAVLGGLAVVGWRRRKKA